MTFKINNVRKSLSLGGLCMVTAILALFCFQNNGGNLLLRKDRSASSYDDKFFGGNSNCKIISESPSVIFQYEIKEGIDFPFAGTDLTFDSLVEIGSFDLLKLSLKSNNLGKLSITFLANSSTGTEIRMGASVFCNKGENTLYIPLEDFKIPNWWLKDKKLDGSIINAKPEKIKLISVSHNGMIDFGKTDEIEIKSVSLDSSNWIAKSILIGGLATATFLMLLTYLKKRFGKEITMEYQPVNSRKIEPLDTSGKDLKDIVDFISTNYNEPKLTLRMIRKKVKVTENKISQIIKSNFNLTFNDYVNQIRLAEAKRLLRESNLNIVEISAISGFGSISSFNRVFKEKQGVSPTEFRRLNNN